MRTLLPRRQFVKSTLGDGIGHREELISLFVEQQAVIAEVRAAHMPVEVLHLQMEREYVCQNGVHGSCDIFRRRRLQVGGSGQGAFLPELQVLCRCDRFLRAISLLKTNLSAQCIFRSIYLLRPTSGCFGPKTSVEILLRKPVVHVFSTSAEVSAVWTVTLCSGHTVKSNHSRQT